MTCNSDSKDSPAKAVSGRTLMEFLDKILGWEKKKNDGLNILIIHTIT